MTDQYTITLQIHPVTPFELAAVAVYVVYLSWLLWTVIKAMRK